MIRHRFAWKTISFPECSLQRMILMLVNAVFKNGIRGSAGMFYLTSSGSDLRCWGPFWAQNKSVGDIKGYPRCSHSSWWNIPSTNMLSNRKRDDTISL